MPEENMKSRVKQQLLVIGFNNLKFKRDKCHASETDEEDLLRIEQPIKWKSIIHSKTKSKQVDILPTLSETQETADGHQLESVQAPEQVKGISNSKKVHFAFLPDKYEPLRESLNEESKADKKYKRKQMLKKCRKNFLKVLCAGWKYFVLGIQEFANNYTMTYPTSFTVTTELH